MPADAPHSSFLSNRQLLRALHHRALVEQAKGILILLYRIDAEQASGVLRDWAAATGSTVVTVARTLVQAVCLEDDSTEWDREVRAHVEAAVGRLDGVRLGAVAEPIQRAPRLRVVR